MIEVSTHGEYLQVVNDNPDVIEIDSNSILSHFGVYLTYYFLKISFYKQEIIEHIFMPFSSMSDDEKAKIFLGSKEYIYKAEKKILEEFPKAVIVYKRS